MKKTITIRIDSSLLDEIDLLCEDLMQRYDFYNRWIPSSRSDLISMLITFAIDHSFDRLDEPNDDGITYELKF